MDNKKPSWSHPCMSCGACCASFRVSFTSTCSVPPDLTVKLDDTHSAMKGTDTHHRPACIALTGRIGRAASCKIYDHRPTPCREFRASYENGYKNQRCDEARAKHGLRPLTKSDYIREDHDSILT